MSLDAVCRLKERGSEGSARHRHDDVLILDFNAQVVRFHGNGPLRLNKCRPIAQSSLPAATGGSVAGNKISMPRFDDGI